MRLLVTSDLHYNHGKSRGLAEDLIARMNQAGGDGVLVVGDTAAGDGDALERCLDRFRIPGPRLFVSGNHELWSLRGDGGASGGFSLALHDEELPRRVAAAGWTWLASGAVEIGDAAVVGSVGWYDYSMADPSLHIPRRFYAAKASPGAALRLSEPASFEPDADDVPAAAREIVARWNDGRYVRLGGLSDEQFLARLLGTLEAQLDAVRGKRRVIAAIHHLPFEELLPPVSGNRQWDFARAYLGSAAIGRLLLKSPNVTEVYCGHSHFPAEATVGHVRAVNLGCGYRWKTFGQIEV